jgi:thioesterase domain-containing protein
LNLMPLARTLDDDHDVYALQSRGLVAGQTPHKKFEEMATDYLAEIRQCQPEGPYLLGGYCVGGLVALEMARQLIADGEEVSTVVLLDTSRLVVPKITWHDRIAMQMQLAKRHGLAYPVTWARNRVYWERRRLEMLAGFVTKDRSHQVAASMMHALANYQMPNYPGSTMLVRYEPEPCFWLKDGCVLDAAREQIFADNNLSSCCSDLKIHTVEGDHESLLVEPRVSEVAALVREALQTNENQLR